MSDFLITLVVALFCTGIALQFIRRFDRDERPLLLVSFLAHEVSGIANIWATKSYYGYGDLLTYHGFGVLAAERLRADFWGTAPDLIALIFHDPTPIQVPMDTLSSSSGTMQGVSAFAMLIFLDSLYGACAFIAGIAFLSKLALYSVVREEFPNLPRRSLIVVCTLLPSVLFWSSSMLKEPLAMIGLLTAVYGWYQVTKGRNRLRSLILVGVGCTSVVLTKGYAFPALGLATAVWHLAREARRRRGDIVFSVGNVFIVGAGAVAVVMATGALLPQFAVGALGDQLAGLQTVGATIDAGTNYSLGATAGDATSQAVLAPLGLLTALFRPLLVEARSLPVLISALEMTVFLIASIVVLFRRGIPNALSELIRQPFLSLCVTFVVVFGTCVGLGTTNLGTLSRYRMPLTPFFATLLLALLHRPQVATSRAAFPVLNPEPMS